MQRESAPLLRVSGLKSGITAVGVRAKLIHISKALIERLLVWKRREAAVADRLIAIELHLERLMEPARADEVDPQAAPRADLLLNAEVVLVVIRRFERSAREGVQADCQRTGRRAGLNSRAGRAPERKIVWNEWFAFAAASTALPATPGAMPMPPTWPPIPPTNVGSLGAFIAARSAICMGMMSLKTPKPL